jgi:hypothetical protein
MENSDDSASDVSETIPEPFEEVELPRLPDDIVEDLTDPINDLLSDEGSLSPLTLDDGTPSVKPRPYQLEMVQEFEQEYHHCYGHRQRQNPLVLLSMIFDLVHFCHFR